jgi:hypothetical protein
MPFVPQHSDPPHFREISRPGVRDSRLRRAETVEDAEGARLVVTRNLHAYTWRLSHSMGTSERFSA